MPDIETEAILDVLKKKGEDKEKKELEKLLALGATPVATTVPEEEEAKKLIAEGAEVIPSTEEEEAKKLIAEGAVPAKDLPVDESEERKKLLAEGAVLAPYQETLTGEEGLGPETKGQLTPEAYRKRQAERGVGDVIVETAESVPAMAALVPKALAKLAISPYSPTGQVLGGLERATGKPFLSAAEQALHGKVLKSEGERLAQPVAMGFEGALETGEFANDIAQRIGKWGQDAYDYALVKLGLMDERIARESEEGREYELYAKGYQRAMKREAKKSLTGDWIDASKKDKQIVFGNLLEAIGAKREDVDKYYDQDMSFILGMVADPVMLTTAGGRLALKALAEGSKNVAVKTAKRVVLEKALKDAKAAAAGGINEEIEKAVIERAAKEPLKSTADLLAEERARVGARIRSEVEAGAEARAKPALERIQKIEDFLTKERRLLPEGAFRTSLDEKVAAGPTGMALRGVARGLEIAGRHPKTTAGVVVATEEFARTGDPESAIIGAIVGPLIVKSPDIVKKYPVLGPAAIGGGLELARTGDPIEALKTAAIVGFVGDRVRGVGSAEMRLKSISTFMDRLKAAPEVLRGAALAAELGGTAKEGLETAARYAKTPEAARILRGAAFGKEAAIGRLERTVAAGTKGAVVASKVIDPAVRAGTIGTELGFLATGDPAEALQVGVQMAAVAPYFHAIGLGIERATGRQAIANAGKFIDFRLRNMPEGDAKNIRDALSKRPAAALRIADVLYKTEIARERGAVRFLNQEQYSKELLSRDPNAIKEQLETPEFTTSAQGNVPPIQFINVDAPNWVAGGYHGLGHVLWSLRMHEGLTEKGKPVGDDMMNAAKMQWLAATFGEWASGLGARGEEGPGKISFNELDDFIRSYYKKTGEPIPQKEEARLARAFDEFFADHSDQFLRMAFDEAGPGGPWKFSEKVERASDEQLQAWIDKSHGSVIFEKNGKGIKMTPESLRAMADAYKAEAVNAGVAQWGAPMDISMVMTPADQVRVIQSVVSGRNEAELSGNQATVDAFNRRYRDIAASGIYLTRPKDPAKIEAEATARAKRVLGRDPTPEEIADSRRYIPDMEIVGKKGDAVKAGEDPAFAKSRHEKKRNAEIFDSVDAALKPVVSSNEGVGMVRTIGVDGKPFWRGSALTDEQLGRLNSVPDAVLPTVIKERVAAVNRGLRENPGMVWTGSYYKAIDRKGNVEVQKVDFAPTSIMVSKAGNVLFVSFDVRRYENAILDPANRQYIEVFKEPGETSLERASERFRDAMMQYLDNHFNGRPGATNLDPSPTMAIAKRDALNGYLGISDETKNPIASDNNFYRSYRADRLYNLAPSEKAPMPITYGPDGRRYAEINFMPADDEGTPEGRQRRFEEDLAAQVEHLDAIAKRKGYADVSEWAVKDADEVAEYARQWRAERKRFDEQGRQMYMPAVPDAIQESRQQILEKGMPMFMPVTPEQDAAYLKAVEAGDMETAQRMVDEAAKKAFGTVGSAFHAIMLDPESLKFTETVQNKLEQVRSDFPRGQGYQPIVSVNNRGNRRIIDGHNRATVARERGDQIPVVELTEQEYKSLKDSGYDDRHIAWATLMRAGERDQAQNLHSESVGGDVETSGRDALNDLIYSPVTRDSSGNVIPLSKRFNAEEKDIRFMPSNEKAESKPEKTEKKIKSTSRALESLKIERNVRENRDKRKRNLRYISTDQPKTKGRK